MPVITVCLEKELHAKLKRYCADHNETIQYHVKELFSRHLGDIENFSGFAPLEKKITKVLAYRSRYASAFDINALFTPSDPIYMKIVNRPIIKRLTKAIEADRPGKTKEAIARGA